MKLSQKVEKERSKRKTEGVGEKGEREGKLETQHAWDDGSR